MIQIIKQYTNLEPSKNSIELYQKWEKLFMEYNAHTNLMSKNEIPVLFEKHVIDSLVLNKTNYLKNGIKICDIGAGGGFPSVILAIFFPDIEIVCVESIGKKTNFISLVKNELKLDNLTVINKRAENIEPLRADILTNRAVGKIEKVWSFSKKHLKKGGLFISYKATTSKEEAKIAAEKFKELKNPEYFPYALPVSENLTRELVIFKL